MPQPSAKKWIWAAWLAFVLGFVLYLFQADRAYHALSGRSHLVRMTAEVPPPARGDPRAANSGFKIAFPKNEFPPGTYAVRMALQSRETGEVLESAQKWTTGR